jgi:plastocyanin
VPVRVVSGFCAALILALGLAACGEDDRGGSVEESGGTSTTGTSTTGTSTTPAPGGAAVAKLQVEETEFAIDPKNPRISKAGVVSFRVKNVGQVLHALEVEGPNGEVETKGIEPGKSASLRVDLSKPGTYEWYCPIGDHKDRGMKGRIVVAGGGSGTSTDDSDTSMDDSGKGEDDSGSDDSGGSSGKGGDDDSGQRSGGGSSGGVGSY